MTKEELQTLSWNSLPKETKDIIIEKYINDQSSVLADIFGHNNILSVGGGLEILTIPRIDAIVIQNNNEYMLSKTSHDDLHRHGFYQGRIELMKELFGPDKVKN